MFEKYVHQHGVADRVRFEEGDFFTDPLPRADVIIMGHILHDWDLEQKRMLLAKAHQALPEGGALIVFEALIDDERRENAFGLLMSLNMLIETPGALIIPELIARAGCAKLAFAKRASNTSSGRTRWLSASSDAQYHAWTKGKKFR